MSVVAISRWAWLLIGVLVGATVGYARQSWRTGDFASRFGVQIKGQRRLETALQQTVEGGGHAFTDIVVYPEPIASASGHAAYVEVVAGRLLGAANGLDSPQPNAAAQWRDAYFVVEPPYRASPSVTVYLDSLKQQGVSYSVAWWRRAGWWHALHIAAGVLGLGILWPTVINLIAFGSWRRPVVEVAPDLPASRPESGPAKPQVSSEELDAVIAGLDAKLASPAEAAERVLATAKPQSVKQLSSAPVEPAAPAAPRGAKAFGAGREDVYPTELKAPKAKPSP